AWCAAAVTSGVATAGPGLAATARLSAGRAVRLGRAGVRDLAGAHCQPFDGAAGRRLAPGEVHASRARHPDEVALVRLQAHLDAGAGGRLVDGEEPLPVVPFDAVVEVTVGVGAVEQAARDVVDPHVQPGAVAAAAQRLARGREPVVGDLPVDVQPLGIDHHGGHPI